MKNCTPHFGVDLLPKFFLTEFNHKIESVFIISDRPTSLLAARIAQWYSAELRAGRLEVRVPAESGNFSLHHRVHTDSGAHEPPIQGVPGALPLEIKRPAREADHSPPSSAEVENSWSYTFTPKHLHGVVLS
jgi:hypothetical protein